MPRLSAFSQHYDEIHEFLEEHGLLPEPPENDADEEEDPDD